MSQLKKGASLTYFNLLLSNIIGLVLTPFIIRSLGNSEFGLYTLIGSFVAYLTLLDLGLNNTIVRYVAKYQVEKDINSEKKFLSTAMWIYCGIALFLVLVGTILYYQLDDLFKVSLTVSELERAKTMFLILIFNLAITIPGGAFEAICNAYEYFIFPRLLKIIKYVMRAICIYAILSNGGKAISLVLIDTILNILVIIFTFIFIYFKLGIRLKFNLYDKQLTKEIFSYSFWVFLYGIVHLIQWNAGQVVLGITTSSLIVAIFGVGVMLGGYYNSFGGALNSVLIPKAMQMVVDNKNGIELTQTIASIGRLNGYIMFFILTSFVLFGQQFINLWIGVEYQDAWFVALGMMFGMTLLLFQVFGNTILEANKKNRFKSILSFITVSTAIIFGYLLSNKYGVYGMIIPLSLSMVINGIIMNLYFKKIFDFNIGLFYKEVFLKQFVVYGVLLLFCLYIVSCVSINTWFKIMIIGAVYSLLFFIISYFFIMNTYEKSFFKSFIK